MPGFMQPEITAKRPHYLIETHDGTWFVPGELVGFSDQVWFLVAKEVDSDHRHWHLIADRLQPYVEPHNTRWQRIEIVSGYLGRYQAPGYLDATDWHFGTNKRELLRELRDLYGE